MAQGLPSSPTLFFGNTSKEDNIDFMANSQHNQHLVDLMNQSNQSDVSYPDADYAIRVSPETLLNPNRHVCEICNKGFAREQNVIVHQRVHNIPFSLKTKTSKDPVTRKVYLCPEPTCIHYNRSHALGDFGGLKKHYLRKHHTQKDYKCNNCCKAYSVETDLKAHLKICGTRKYKCHCGTCFSREYCDAPEQVGVAKYPQRLNTGDSSINNISSNVSPSPMLGIGSNGFNTNENNYNLNDPRLSTFQNPSNYYHSVTPDRYHSSQLGEDHSRVMTNTSMSLNMSNNNPNFYSSSTHPNQHEYQMKSDMDFYANILMDNIPLDSVMNHQNVNMIGDGGTSYGTGGSSDLFADGRLLYEPSSSPNMTAAMTTNTQNGISYPESGTGDVGTYGNGSYYDYDYGYGYGHGSGQSAATAGDEALPQPHLNQDGFWY